MKKVIICMVILCMSLLPISCSKTNQASSIAKEFLQKVYTVSENELNVYNESVKNQDFDSLVSIYTKFKSDTTDTAYETLMKERTYHTLITAAQNNYLFQCKEVSLSQSSKNNNTIQYDYTVKAIVTDINSKNQNEITESGIIQVTKEKEWRVNYIKSNG